MRPMKELIVKGFELPTHEMQAEIDERQAILDTLPPISKDSEVSDTSPSSVDEKRLKIEKQIFMLNWRIASTNLSRQYSTLTHMLEHSGISNEALNPIIKSHQTLWESSYQFGYEAGRKFERRQQGSKGGKKKKENIYDSLIQDSIKKAHEIWDRDHTIRIGKVADEIQSGMKGKRYCPTKATVIKWLKKANEEGHLNIPPEALKLGRPKKHHE